VLESMTAPRRGRLGASHAQVGDAPGRTDWDHARGQALCELVEHLPTDHLHAKTAATMVVMLDEAVLRGALKAAGLDTGGSLSAGDPQAAVWRRDHAGGARRQLSATRSWRTRRLFSQAQRIALGLAHRTCAAQGCERPFAWCELHHRKPWHLGGPTDLSQAIPLCWFHHRRIHDDTFAHREQPDASITFHPRP
ncbi:MAG: HNH endonuclease, partial [Actinomycetota bacterium]|nr:HNH endonuclease [Actinomycetota bacterium]